VVSGIEKKEERSVAAESKNQLRKDLFLSDHRSIILKEVNKYGN